LFIPRAHVRSHGGMILTGENWRHRRKPCPSATLPTTNPTWIDAGAKPGLRFERPPEIWHDLGGIVLYVLIFACLDTDGTTEGSRLNASKRFPSSVCS
jgi:hypothetical protein